MLKVTRDWKCSKVPQWWCQIPFVHAHNRKRIGLMHELSFSIFECRYSDMAIKTNSSVQSTKKRNTIQFQCWAQVAHTNTHNSHTWRKYEHIGIIATLKLLVIKGIGRCKHIDTNHAFIVFETKDANGVAVSPISESSMKIESQGAKQRMKSWRWWAQKIPAVIQGISILLQNKFLSFLYFIDVKRKFSLMHNKILHRNFLSCFVCLCFGLQKWLKQ